jgi:hypothetical protein
MGNFRGLTPLLDCCFKDVLSSLNLQPERTLSNANGLMIGREDLDPLAPQREAAIFYGLFLRGHSADDLRRDIDVPRPLLNKWLQPQRYEEGFRDSLRRMYTYRKKVLAIFDELVLKEKSRVRIH